MANHSIFLSDAQAIKADWGYGLPNLELQCAFRPESRRFKYSDVAETRKHSWRSEEGVGESRSAP